MRQHLDLAALLLATWMMPALASECVEPPVPAATQEWVLLVREYPGDPGHEQTVLRDARGIWIETADLRRWRVPDARVQMPMHEQRWHLLSAVAGVKAAFNPCEQVLDLDLSSVRRSLTSHSLRPSLFTRPTQTPPGGYLNLDVQHLGGRNGSATAGLLEAGFFNSAGRGGQTLVARPDGAVRLDSFWQMEDSENLRTLRLGDAISRSAAWGRSVRYGGLQWSTDFSLQPYLPLFPQPGLRGEAAVPSTLDVFVDGSLRSRQAVDAGPFELRDIPAITGSGEALVVARDVLGRETRITQPFYVSPTLLRSGLQDYSLDTGWLRNNYTVESNDYRDVFAAATLKRGFSERFTGELRAEWQHEGMTLGGSGLRQLGSLGLLTGTLAFGGSANDSGVLAAIGFEREQRGAYSFAVRSQWTEDGFAQVGQLEGQRPSRRLDLARLGFQPHDGGSLSLLWTFEDARDRSDIEVRSLSYGLRLNSVSNLDVSYTQTCAPDCDPAVFLNFNWTFGGPISAFAQVARSNGLDRYRAGVQGHPADTLGWSWRAAAEQSADGVRADAGAVLRDERGIWSADVSADGGANYRLGAASGLAFLDGAMFWTRPVTGSFATVDVGDLAGVDVYADRRRVARTDEHGRALIPDLRAYEINTVSVDAADIPIERQLDSLELHVVPRARTGVTAKFALDGEGRWLTLRNRDGSRIATVAKVTDAVSGEEWPLSGEGAVHVPADRLPLMLIVDQAGAVCRVMIETLPPDRGEAMCTEMPP